MAQERTFDVADLIEDRKLGWPQILIALWLCTLMVLEGYDMQSLSFAAPVILREWHVSRGDFGVVMIAHLFGYFFGALILSFFGDRIGRKNIIIAGAVPALPLVRRNCGAGVSRPASDWAAQSRPALHSRPNTCQHAFVLPPLG